jgi:hypothetical protein
VQKGDVCTIVIRKPERRNLSEDVCAYGRIILKIHLKKHEHLD